MKRLFVGLLLSLCAGAVAAAGSTWVQPTVRANGTYVPGHYRTNPNATPYDNYSTRGNVNPYTGRRGTVAPNPYQPYAPYSQPAQPRPRKQWDKWDD